MGVFPRKIFKLLVSAIFLPVLFFASPAVFVLAQEYGGGVYGEGTYNEGEVQNDSGSTSTGGFYRYTGQPEESQDQEGVDVEQDSQQEGIVDDESPKDEYIQSGDFVEGEGDDYSAEDVSNEEELLIDIKDPAGAEQSATGERDEEKGPFGGLLMIIVLSVVVLITGAYLILKFTR